ncbi:uncharacterized protein LOC5507743 isoform X2 [Nematostella vectensis]|uniref:uncharacterized protein LOC5507743 isoform X2 n=1 Tax=Nematostella vectensis TaxID=45351 RepID=UPI0020773DE6|nr:uncharacterized protein LOC5507743 isoform X2 [Nematostella vectensis]
MLLAICIMRHDASPNIQSCVTNSHMSLCKKSNVVTLQKVQSREAQSAFAKSVFLVLTPNYIIPMKSFPVMSGGSGRAFCRAIFSTYCLFVCGKASNTTIMCLAIERWCAVVRPTKYKANFNRKRVSLYIVLIWLVAAATEVFELFIADLMPDGRCEWITPFYGEKLEKGFLVFHITITFYIPMTITWITFAHIWYRMSHNQVSTQHGDAAKKNVVRMCMLAALLLTLCWFPTETFWILLQHKVATLPRAWYFWFNFLAFFNSCCNPPLYCLTNKTYRREFLKLFGCGMCGAQVAPDSTVAATASGQAANPQAQSVRYKMPKTTKHSVVEESVTTDKNSTCDAARAECQSDKEPYHGHNLTRKYPGYELKGQHPENELTGQRPGYKLSGVHGAHQSDKIPEGHHGSKVTRKYPGYQLTEHHLGYVMTGPGPGYDVTGQHAGKGLTGPRPGYGLTRSRPGYKLTGQHPGYEMTGPRPRYNMNGPRPGYEFTGQYPGYEFTGEDHAHAAHQNAKISARHCGNNVIRPLPRYKLPGQNHGYDSTGQGHQNDKVTEEHNDNKVTVPHPLQELPAQQPGYDLTGQHHEQEHKVHEEHHGIKLIRQLTGKHRRYELTGHHPGNDLAGHTHGKDLDEPHDGYELTRHDDELTWQHPDFESNGANHDDGKANVHEDCAEPERYQDDVNFGKLYIVDQAIVFGNDQEDK